MTAAWPGLARPGNWDAWPLVWAAALLIAVWAMHGGFRWWLPPVALAAGLWCSTLAAHFGPLAGVAFVIAVAFALVPLVKAPKSP